MLRRELCDLTLFAVEDLDTCLIRRLKRDIAERGRTVDSVLTQYHRFVKPGFRLYVRVVVLQAHSWEGCILLWVLCGGGRLCCCCCCCERSGRGCALLVCGHVRAHCGGGASGALVARGDVVHVPVLLQLDALLRAATVMLLLTMLMVTMTLIARHYFYSLCCFWIADVLPVKFTHSSCAKHKSYVFSLFICG